MGKIAPVSSKYLIVLSIKTDGVVEKPDVIGAIFGQTEGLLGNELELRELQQSGRIGRIDVDLKVVDGKTVGNIYIPSSLNKVETSLVGAALETIDRIGPCISKIRVERIEDVRISKRNYIIKRAKDLLKNIIEGQLPDSQEIAEEVKESVRTMDVINYHGLTAGPAINESNEIILVEGRADVVNLLKHGFKNTIAMNGTSVPKPIVELSKEKKIVVFLDGDRGGDLILKELKSKGVKVDYIARAPDGKEVEELTSKEIHKALRSKEPVHDFNNQHKNNNTNFNSRKITPTKVKIPRKEWNKFKEYLESLIGTRGAYLLNEELDILGKVPVDELENTLKDMDGVFAVVFDGEITKDLAKLCASKKIKYLVGMEGLEKVRGVKCLNSNFFGI